MKTQQSSIPIFQRDVIQKIRHHLLAWYEISQRDLPWRKTKNPYSIWVSEVMLQQTRVITAIPYFERFMEAFPNVEALAKSGSQKVLKLWEGLGYYARARNLHKACQMIVSEYGGNIPETYENFRQLPGVGDYIACAVTSIAFGKVRGAADANVKRVIARLLCLDLPVNTTSSNAVFQREAQALVSRKDPGAFNQAMMELGALVCSPSEPSCTKCPISKFCTAFSAGKTAELPRRLPKKKVPTHHIAVGVIQHGKKLLITKRKPDGLLGGLWEFPGGKVEKKEGADQACVREIFEETGLRVKNCEFLTRIRHAYTHFRIEMDVFMCSGISGKICLDGPVDYRWVTREQLSDFPFPKANLKFIPLIPDNK